MAKYKKLAAPEVVYMMGLTPPAKTADGKDIKYGIKALVGQYTKQYVREPFLLESTCTPPGRISRGRQMRYKRDRGSEGVLDLSEVINARR